MLAFLGGSLVLTPAAHAATTPTAASSPVIRAAGDIACAPGATETATNCHQSETSDLLSGADAVLALGDLQYNGGSYSDFLASYDQSWGQYKGITHPVPGNHEYGSKGAGGYFQYWGSQAGASGKGWYSFNLGSWHLVAINAGICASQGCPSGSEQEKWVKADLAAHKNTCTLAFWHEPRWASGSVMGDNTYMSPIYTDLYNAKVDLLLTGHNHAYERFAPMDPSGARNDKSGVQEFIVGTGGEDHAGTAPRRQNSQVRNNSTFGVLSVTLNPTSYNWEFLPEAGASFSDSGSRACH